MKIQKCSIESTKKQDNSVPKHQMSPTFKGAGVTALNASGGFMQWVEDGGFLVSFLLQDALGMTLPRSIAGFLRDKEVTGEYNKQEGLEVLGREGLTGPIMMAIAPISFAIAAIFGKSTSVNSQLIKRFGNSLKELISKPEFEKQLLNNKEKFKEVFYKNNIEKMLNDTLGKENVTDELINKVLKEVLNYDTIPSDANLKGLRGKSKYRKERIAQITQYINDIKYKTSSDLNLLDCLKVGEGKNQKVFSTKNTIDAMVKYSNDAISLNKHLDKLNENAAEDIKNKSIAKRFITNISTMAATLGVLSILPKLYIRHSVSPGARTAMQMKENRLLEEQSKLQQSDNTAEDNQTGEIAFKGKKPSALGRFGKFLSDHTNEKFSSELEYNGHNFTNTLMAGLSLFGLLLPRGLRAYNRAQVDDNGKRDWTEIYEILIRDVSSSLSVVFAVPMLTRLCVSSYENKSGFVLMHKDRKMSKPKAFLDLINPYSGSHVLTNSEISSLYNNIDSTEKMINFCKYIDNNNGDLEKIISKSQNLDSVFKDSSFKLSDLSSKDKSEKNKKILEFFEKFEKTDEANKKIAELMQGTGLKHGNKIASFARNLNSVPGFLATIFISPAILGWFIPRLTYANTRRLHQQKAEAEEKRKINTAA